MFSKFFINQAFKSYTSFDFIYTYTRHFRPKLVNGNERVYCTPIDRAFKM